MMSESVGNNNNGGGKYHPFTASQWQELEHQALVYKYMISGMPIPPHLLFTIKTSLDSSSSSTKLLLHHHQPPPHPSRAGWNYFHHQMGFGRKIDPEPGRCRRTDGKKWRCSKEAYPDSKYCERHMHRGRNRSRKPVELLNNNIPISHSKSLLQAYPSPNSHPLSSSSSSDYNYYTTKTSSQDHLLESTPYNRKSYGMKEEIIDEHSFFSEESPSSGAIIKTTAASLGMGDSWQLQPLGINSTCSSKSKQTPFSGFHHQRNGYLYNQQQQQQQQDQSYYHQLATKDEPQKVMHHFFDEWPPNDDKDSSTTTQLSISIPGHFCS